MLLFVYNADAGLFNALADSAHKLLSPRTYACRLCHLTYGLLTVRPAWREFLATLPEAPTFLHRDEFLRAHPHLADTLLPAVFVLRPDGPRLALDAHTLQTFDTLEALIAAVRSLTNAPDAAPDHRP